MRLLYVTSNELLQYCRIGYIFSDYFVHIKNEKEEKTLKAIRITNDDDTKIRSEVTERLSPFLSSANIITLLHLDNEQLEDEPYFLLPLTVIKTIVVRDENARLHLKALLKDTPLENKQISITIEPFTEFTETQQPISSEEEPLYHPILRILDGLTAAISNLFLAKDWPGQPSINPLLSQEFAHITFFPVEVHQHLRGILRFENNQTEVNDYLLLNYIKPDLEYLTNDISNKETDWFKKGGDYKNYYDPTKKLYELYTKSIVDLDLNVVAYLGHILLTRIAIGETGKISLLQSIYKLLEKVDPTQPGLKQMSDSIRSMLDLANANLNREEFEKKIGKGTSMRTPLQLALYLFFKHYSDEILGRLDYIFTKNTEKNLTPLAAMIPYLYHGFVNGFSGFSASRKKEIVDKFPYCFIWTLHIMRSLMKESSIPIVNIPAAIAIQSPFCIESKDGLIQVYATENKNLIFQINVNEELYHLQFKEKQLEAELEKIKNQIQLLASSKKLFTSPQHASRKKKDKRSPTKQNHDKAVSVSDSAKTIMNIPDPKKGIETTGDLFSDQESIR